MFKRKLTVFATSALFLLGATACNNNGALEDRHRDTSEFKNVNYTNDRNMGYTNDFTKDYNGRKALHNVNRVEISNLSTNISSNDYPHTRALLTQDAKYKFVEINPTQDNNMQQRQRPSMQQEWQDKQIIQNNTPEQAQQQGNLDQQPVQDNGPDMTQVPQQVPQQRGSAQQPAQNNRSETTKTPQNISQVAQKVIDLTNAERRKNGLPDLKGDSSLSNVAQKKSEDMQQKHYFSHTSPTYGSPFDMMRDFGITYKTAGENIAQGQQTAEQVVQAWMNSEGHRANILNRNFTHIGVGYEQSGKHWVQMFIGK